MPKALERRTNQYLTADKMISGSQAEVWVTYNDTGDRFCYARLINLSAKCKINKKKVSILGRTGKVTRAFSWEGEGSAKLYYCDSTQRQKVKEFALSGKMFSMDIEVYNNDESSSMTEQGVILKNCILDDIILAAVDIEAEELTEEINFSFDDFEITKTFEERTLEVK